MPSLREYNERLASMASMRRVTSTMKLVAGSHLHRVQGELHKPEAFARSLAELKAIVDQPRFAKDRLLQPPPEKESRILLIIMSADRGLCGGFNGAIIHAVRDFVAQHGGRAKRIGCVYVGQKAAAVLKHDLPAVCPVQPAPGLPTVADSARIAKFVMRGFHWKMCDEVWLISNRFINSMTNECVTERLLPQTRPPQPKEPVEPMALPRIVEPNDARMLETVISLWLQHSLYFAMLHSATGELAARVMAMDNSTMNLNAMEKELKTQRNRARQAAITNELTEIVSGAEALN